MYIEDHPPPHVHVKLCDGRECIVELDSIKIIGRIEGREMREVLDWISAQRDFLHDEWRRYNP
ncbi:MAG TPA: DUF4160 domain-containing protein [Halothiobacillaceae bacterium]|nr:DUF4160 domain-containing protein [Halothiobacillaceae bacterium]